MFKVHLSYGDKCTNTRAIFLNNNVHGIFDPYFVNKNLYIMNYCRVSR